jgi:hypothetical protein
MPRGSNLTLSEQAAVGLFFIQRYRFLTIDQFARATALKRSTAADQLRMLERHSLLGYFGNTGLGGRGKTPKVYFLTRRGWEVLARESGVPAELIGSFKEIHVQTRWSPQMDHRLATIDVMLAAEGAVHERSQLSIVRTFLDYRRVKRGSHIVRETLDYVAKEETTDNRIIPDAAFVLENIESGRRALFFLEVDMGTERIISQITRDKKLSLLHKLAQYDVYLQGMRYRQTYAPFGDFRFFTLLFITQSEQRVDNIRRGMAALSPELSAYYRLTTYRQAMADFLGPIWKSRRLEETGTYSLVREQERVDSLTPGAAAGESGLARETS